MKLGPGAEDGEVGPKPQQALQWTFSFGPLNPPPFPTASLISGPLGVLMFKCGLTPGDLCCTPKLWGTPGELSGS